MTKKIDNGGPAFPRSQSTYTCAQDGMSLRDHFAGQAIPALIATPPYRRFVSVANDAYKLADAMLAARKLGATD